MMEVAVSQFTILVFSNDDVTEVSYKSSLFGSLYLPCTFAPSTSGCTCECGCISTYQIRKLRHRMFKDIKQKQ